MDRNTYIIVTLFPASPILLTLKFFVNHCTVVMKSTKIKLWKWYTFLSCTDDIFLKTLIKEKYRSGCNKQLLLYKSSTTGRKPNKKNYNSTHSSVLNKNYTVHVKMCCSTKCIYVIKIYKIPNFLFNVHLSHVCTIVVQNLNIYVIKIYKTPDLFLTLMHRIYMS